MRRIDVGIVAVGARADLIILETDNPIDFVYRPGVPLIATEGVPLIATEGVPLIATVGVPLMATDGVPPIVTVGVPVIATLVRGARWTVGWLTTLTSLFGCAAASLVCNNAKTHAAPATRSPRTSARS